MRHRAFVDEVEKRTSHNALVREQKEAWWLDANNTLASIITESMEKTNPALRDTLQDRYHVHDGYYAGYDMLEHVKQWAEEMMERMPEHDFYERVHTLIKKNRLPAGATAKDFSAVVRRFTDDVNPCLRAPYTGEK